MTNSHTIRTESKPGMCSVDVYHDTIAKGRISRGGYIGPEVVLPCEIGYTTTVIDDGYVGGMRTEIRVTEVSDGLVHIEGRKPGGKFARWNPLPRIERKRPAQECSECRAPVGPGGHAQCPTHRAA